MSRTGFVIKTSGEHAIISTTRRGDCESCSEHGSCSDSFEESAEEELTAINGIHAQPGDHVKFDLAGHTELKVSLIVWVFPLAGLILGAVMGASYHTVLSLTPDAATLLGALLGFLTAFGLVMLYDRKFSDKRKLLPHILKIIAKPTYIPFGGFDLNK